MTEASVTAEWTTSRFEELSINFDGKRRPVKESDRQPGPFPYYGASGTVDYVDDYLFDGEYLLIAEDGENLRTRQTPISFLARGKFWVNNHAHIVTGNEKADTRFLMYALRYIDIDAYLTGAVMPKLTQGNLNGIEVRHPPIREQRAITGVLGALDDMIEQNRRTAQALERLARAIFRAWFVDFEPVKVKAAGATAFPSMPQPVFDALPTRFVDSDIGPVPEGWDVLRLDGLLTLQRGFDLPKPSRVDGSHPILAASGLNGWHSESKVTGPGVTTGRSGVLGQVFFVDRDFWPLNTSLWVKEFKRSNPWHAYFLLQTLDLAQFNAGSAVPTLNRNHVHSLPIVAPPETLLRAFEETCKVTFPLDQHSRSESEMLATIRDYLLPKLLRGDVRVEAAHG